METTPADLRRLEVSAFARRHAFDVRRIERVLAAARVALCFACLFAAFVGSSIPREHATVLRWVLTAYTAEGVVILVLTTISRKLGPVAPLLVHVADFGFATATTSLTGGSASPFLVMFLFVVLASAYRWRLRETMWSGAAALVAVGGQWWLVEAPALDLDRFVLRGTYIVVAAVLLGFLAEDEKQQRAELSIAGELLGAIQSQAGFRAALRHVCKELLAMTEAHEIVVAAREIDASRVVIWNAKPHQGHTLLLTSSELPDPRHDAYFFDAQGDAWSIVRRRGDTCALAAIDRDGQVLRHAGCSMDPQFWVRHSAAAAAVISVGFGNEWRGRVFVLRRRPFTVSELRLVHRVLCQLVPAMHSQYLLRRLRSRVGAAERRRIARELHDGVIQSLLGLEFQAAALRRQLGGRDAHIDAQLQRMQHVLAEEARTVRDVMHQIRPVELKARQLVPAIAEIVERFGGETGIHAEFQSSAPTLHLAPRVAGELVRTVQEALTNVRKHAAARHVRVRLSEERDLLTMTIANDGRPFSFAGRVGLEELDARRLGPRVIKERVREMGGHMVIESSADRGVVLEISVPRTDQERRSG
jgi:signal transduction histidine kinase